MMPPTGLTLFIHAGVIVMKKTANLLHRPFCEDTYKEETTTRQAVSSFAIMSLVFVYVLAIITGFLSKAMEDDRATWKIFVRVFHTLEDTSPTYHAPPIYGYSIAEAEESESILLSLNYTPIPHFSPPENTPL